MTLSNLTYFLLLFATFHILPILAAGPITITSTSKCIIIAQIDPISNTFTAGRPICETSGGGFPWPISSGGAGDQSSLAIYANFDGDGIPSCVMGMSPAQARYLVGRNLEWKGDSDQMFDNTSGGLLQNTETWAPMSWYVILPPDTRLED